MRIVLLSDIHANVTALQAVLEDINHIGSFDSIALLGDLVNYGPRPNETIDIVRNLPYPITVNLWGNHEYSIFGGSLERFSTDRGRSVLKYTKELLTEESRSFLLSKMNTKGYSENLVEYHPTLFVHGNRTDPYWGKLDLNEMQSDVYKNYDFVISGHSHIPHYVEHFYKDDNPCLRNKKRTIFINPGSVGQPRNHNPLAQYGILETNSCAYERRCVWYDVEKEQKLYDDRVDIFYRDRLKLGV